MTTKVRNHGVVMVLEIGSLIPYCLCLYSSFLRSGGRGVDKSDVKRSSAAAVFHTVTDLKPPYMIYVWVDLKLSWIIIIQYAIYSGDVSRKSVLCRDLTDGMILVLAKGSPTFIKN